MHGIVLGNNTTFLKPVEIIGFTLRTLILKLLKFHESYWFYCIVVCATALLASHVEL